MIANIPPELNGPLEWLRSLQNRHINPDLLLSWPQIEKNFRYFGASSSEQQRAKIIAEMMKDIILPIFRTIGGVF
jgi:hypothetical protein